MKLVVLASFDVIRCRITGDGGADMLLVVAHNLLVPTVVGSHGLLDVRSHAVKTFRCARNVNNRKYVGLDGIYNERREDDTYVLLTVWPGQSGGSGKASLSSWSYQFSGPMKEEESGVHPLEVAALRPLA